MPPSGSLTRNCIYYNWRSLFVGKCPVVLPWSPRLSQVLCGRTRLHEKGFSACAFRQVCKSKWFHGQVEPREDYVRRHAVGVVRRRGIRWFPVGRRRRDCVGGTRRWFDIRHNTWSINQWEKPYYGLAGVSHVMAKMAFLVGWNKVPKAKRKCQDLQYCLVPLHGVK